jgi:hypothetical protein
MTVQFVEIPYQFDVTAICPVVNQLIAKVKELAKEHAVPLPPECQQYHVIDLASITEIMSNISKWQAEVVNAIGLEPTLKPKLYGHIDYNDIGSMANYYSVTLNRIIQAAEKTTQSPPESYT